MAVEGSYLWYLRRGYTFSALELSKRACCESSSRLTLRAKVCEWWSCGQCEAFAQTQSQRKSGAQREAQRWKVIIGAGRCHRWIMDGPLVGKDRAREAAGKVRVRASFRDPFAAATRREWFLNDERGGLVECAL